MFGSKRNPTVSPSEALIHVQRIAIQPFESCRSISLSIGAIIDSTMDVRPEQIRTAVDIRNTEAHHQDGFSLWGGQNIVRDRTQAAHSLKLAADQGIAEARFVYGFQLSEGDGISISRSQSASYLKLVADQGDMEAQFE
jgi:TPR repeat protein